MKHIHLGDLQRALPQDFYLALEDYPTSDALGSATLASGDWTISKDGGTFANLTTLPAVTPAATKQVKLALSEAELDCGWITILGVDQTTEKEWEDICITARIVGATVKVVTDGGNSASSFKISRFGLGTEATDELKPAFLQAQSGALKGQVQKVTGYVTATDIVTVSPAFPSTPADGVYFKVVNG